jgi:hypothetical protein
MCWRHSSCFVKGVFTFFIHRKELLCVPPHKLIRTRLLYTMRDSSRVLIRNNSLLLESAFLLSIFIDSSPFFDLSLRLFNSTC